MDSQLLLRYLPAYKWNEQLITDDQNVTDIIDEIIDAHYEFSYHYDTIAHFFSFDDEIKICKKLFKFCKGNIYYEIEDEDNQTTRSPATILEFADGDCKHYAGFIGGVLSALNRKGYDIDWCYRFSSYRIFHNQEPYHVFIVIYADGQEIWIDPVLNYFDERLEPTFFVDEKINDMALKRLSGFGDQDAVMNGMIDGTYDIGYINGVVTSMGAIITPVINWDQLNFDGTGKYSGVFGPQYLGLSGYADYTNGIGTNWGSLADEINDLIAAGPSPGHEVPPDFVKWVFDNSIRSWNFYYKSGVVPGFNPGNRLPANYPRPVLTADGRLTLDHDALLDDYRNGEIHILTAWLQSIIAEEDSTPYPLKPRDVKLFSQSYTGNPNNPNANFFNEWRGSGVLDDIGKALEDSFNFVKEGVLKILNSLPRNALLLLNRWNYKNMAVDAWNKIQTNPGVWDQSVKKWKRAGGNPDKLYDAIKDGKNKAAISGPVPLPEDEVEIEEKEDFLDKLPGLLAYAAALIKLLIDLFDNNKEAREIANRVPFDKNTDIFADPDNDENSGGGNDDLPGKQDWIIPVLIGLGILLFTKK